ncbi:MAG: hypothetical protein V1739_00535 [Candidatus Omnitrophota bacterium]
MTIVTLRDFFFWCSVINMGLILWWFLIIALAHDWVYKLHGKWFKISEESFDRTHYSGIVFFKIAVFVLNIVPYFALRIIG